MRIGILGAGQLGRMLALAGYPLGMRTSLYDPTEDPCAGHVAPVVRGTYDDRDLLRSFAGNVDVITYEFENVPVAAATALSSCLPVRPTPVILKIGQDRIEEKQFFQGVGLETALFVPVSSLEQLSGAMKLVGLPAILKTRMLGYDGKGQVVIRSNDELEAAWMSLEQQPCILEALVPFDRELSMLVVRDTFGNTVPYPWVENVHRDGILRVSRAPAHPLDAHAAATALRAIAGLMEQLDYVGVLAVEFFEVRGQLLANELAPRVHNSGHWTIEGAVTSQFENHMRAVAGLPLGGTDARGYSAMVNLIGNTLPLSSLLAKRGPHVHLYGKVSRPGRKLGHLTINEPSVERRDAMLTRVLERVL